VLPVGGIKEKVLAARRAGIRTVILPRRNQSDLDDIPPELRAEMETLFVDTVDEVLAHALRDSATERPVTAAPIREGRTALN
jgi:ATP-dependent Lon protease